MYDAESRGARLLERSKLSHELQRQVLIGTQQTLVFDTVKDVLLFQYPDHRPPPQIMGAFGPRDDAPRRDQHQQRPYRPWGKGKGDSKGHKGGGKPDARRQVYATETTDLPDTDNQEDISLEQEEDNLETIPEDVEDDEAPEEPVGEDIFDLEADPDIQQILTVTARKLSGVVQARKFGNTSSQPPRKSIQDRKRTSHCAACGQPGHWKGDPECTASSTSKPKGNGHTAPSKGQPSGGKGPRAVHFVSQHYGGRAEESNTDLDHHSHQIYMISNHVPVHEVRLADATKAAGYVILDTACQRLCAGNKWATAHTERLQNHRLQPVWCPKTEMFEFGKGCPIKSDFAMFFPAFIAGSLSIMAPCILEADIPCLASRPMLTTLGAIIDLASNQVYLEALNITTPLVIVNGHIAINVLDVKWRSASVNWWRQHEAEVQQQASDGDFTDEVHVLKLPSLKPADSTPDLEPDATRSAPSTAMASGMETFGHEGEGLRPPGKALHESTATTGGGHYIHLLKDPTEVSDGTRLHPLRHDHPGSKPDGRKPGVLASPHKAIRQPPRELRTVHGVQGQVEVERSSPRMGALHRGIQFLTVATAFISNCLGQFVETGNAAHPAYPERAASDYQEIYGQAFQQATSDYVKGKTTGPDRGDGEVSMGLSGPGPKPVHQHQPGRQGGLRLGERRRLVNDLNKASEVLTIENSIYDKIPAAMNVNHRMDIMELFAGEAKISELAPRHQLRALQPMDILYDVDLASAEGQRLCTQAQNKFKPLVLVAGIACTKWSIFNENLNYAGPGRAELLARLREEELPMVDFTVERCLQQIADGNFFALENPAGSRLWEQASVMNLTTRDDVYVVRCHSGAYGATNSRGELIKKTFQWLTNSGELAEALSRKLSTQELMYCAPISGSETRRSGEYPKGMVAAILHAIKTEARRRCPQRFLKVNQVYYQPPAEDPAAWSEVITQTRRIFETTATRSLALPDDDPLFTQVSQPVPWDLKRIQLSRGPVQRRLPKDIQYSHRGAVIEYADGTIDVEAESLDGMHFPKQKFKKAVSYAVFWFGDADPGAAQPEQLPAPPDPDPHEPPADQRTATTTTRSPVTFPGCPNDVTTDTKAAVTRLHLNLGHPTEKEMIRLLAWQGAVSRHLLTAVKHLQCESCSRTKLPRQPRPSALPVANMGQFNDHVQSDIFYCRHVMGVNHAVIGIVDQSTLLHQAARLDDISSETVTQKFRELWIRPYGLPMELRVDPGGSYASSFRDYMQYHGVFLEVIPAEAHWRIGLVERRNSVLRDVLERIIDNQAVATCEDIDLALEFAVHALNSMTYTHGRPAYMAVFGQIPRLPGGLLQDDRSLVTSSDHTGFTRPDVLRAEAIKAIAEVNTSQALCRALLRKTASQDADPLLPGQHCAYWRWQNPRGRSTKKRGGWVIARFLSYDPDKRSAWLHSGTNTVQLSLEQLRHAFGFEHWTPDPSDIRAIKDAASNIRQDVWQDERAAAPPLEEDSYDYDLELEQPVPMLPLLAPSDQAPQQQHPAQQQPADQAVQTTPRPDTGNHTSVEYHRYIRFNQPPDQQHPHPLTSHHRHRLPPRPLWTHSSRPSNYDPTTTTTRQITHTCTW